MIEVYYLHNLFCNIEADNSGTKNESRSVVKDILIPSSSENSHIGSESFSDDKMKECPLIPPGNVKAINHVFQIM